MNKRLGLLIIVILLSGFFTNLVSAAVELTSYWEENDDLYLEVDRGDIPKIFVGISSTINEINYEVELIHNGNFVETLYEYSGSGDYHETFLDIDSTNLEGGEVYVIRVKANDGLNGNEWQDLILFVNDVINQPPYVPFNPNPVDNAQDIELNPLLGWNGGDPDGDVVYYDVYFGEDKNSLVLVASDSILTNFQVSSLNYETTYYWKIVANDGEDETQGDLWRFTTIEEIVGENHAPYVPNYLNPINGAEDVELEVSLKWEGADPDGDILHYDVYFGTDENNLELIVEDLDMDIYLVNNLDYETTYYWKIASKDSEFVTYGLIGSFTTIEETIDENHDPIIESIDDDRARCGKRFRLQVEADDVDNDDLTYLDDSDLFDIDEDTGLISFVPSCRDKGTYDITIEVRDGHGGSDTERFELKIYKKGSSDDSDVFLDSIVEYGECVDDNDGDIFGVRTVFHKIADLVSGNVYLDKTSEEVCQLVGLKLYKFEDSRALSVLVALIFLMITVPIAFFGYRKLS
jgi:hypothetical protein